MEVKNIKRILQVWDIRKNVFLNEIILEKPFLKMKNICQMLRESKNFHYAKNGHNWVLLAGKLRNQNKLNSISNISEVCALIKSDDGNAYSIDGIKLFLSKFQSFF